MSCPSRSISTSPSRALAIPETCSCETGGAPPDLTCRWTFARKRSRGCASMMNQPRTLWLVRHAQSEGNVIRAAAARDAEVLEIADRDMDVPLSDLGRRQASAFGAWVRGRPEDQRPEVILSSPYERATQTAEA